MPNLSGGPADTTNFCSGFLNTALPRSLSEDTVASSTATSGTCSGGRHSSIAPGSGSERDTISLEDRGQKDIFGGFSYVMDGFGSSMNASVDDNEQTRPVERGNGNVEECCELTINSNAANASRQLANGFHIIDELSAVDNLNDMAVGHVKLKGKRNRKNKGKKQQQQNGTKIIKEGEREKEDYSSLSLAEDDVKPPNNTELAATGVQTATLMHSLKRSSVSSLADRLEKQELLVDRELRVKDTTMSQVSRGYGRPPPPMCSHRTLDTPVRKPSSPGGTRGKILIGVDDNPSAGDVQTPSWASVLVASQGNGFYSGNRVVEPQYVPQIQVQAHCIPPLLHPEPPIMHGSSELLESCTKLAVPTENDEWHVMGTKGKTSLENSLMTPQLECVVQEPIAIAESCVNSAEVSMENEWHTVGTKGKTKRKNCIKYRP